MNSEAVKEDPTVDIYHIRKFTWKCMQSMIHSSTQFGIAWSPGSCECLPAKFTCTWNWMWSVIHSSTQSGIAWSQPLCQWNCKNVFNYNTLWDAIFCLVPRLLQMRGQRSILWTRQYQIVYYYVIIDHICVNFLTCP